MDQPATPFYRTVPGNGIEPVVQLATLEAFLTETTYEAVEAASGSREVAVRDGGAGLVMRLSDALTRSLADASDDVLARVAPLWADTEEFFGEGEPEPLLEFLRDLRSLAREGREGREFLYCWVAV